MNLNQQTAILLFLLFSTLGSFAQWKPAGDKIKTKWGEQLDEKNVLAAYPRPILKRQQYKNLNGLWNYAITDTTKSRPGKFQGNILVPFAAESSLSLWLKP